MQLLANMSHLEAKQNNVEIEARSQDVKSKKPVSLNSILEDDNDEQQLTKFAGAVSEQIEARKILGKRIRRQIKIEEITALVPAPQKPPRFIGISDFSII